MKNILYISLILIFTSSCKENNTSNTTTQTENKYPKGSIFSITYRKHTEIDFLKDYKQNVGSLVAYVIIAD